MPKIQTLDELGQFILFQLALLGFVLLLALLFIEMIVWREHREKRRRVKQALDRIERELNSHHKHP